MTTTTTTFGEISYNDDIFANDGKKNTNSKDLFLRLDEGVNEIRIVTAPFQYLVHKYKKEGDSGFGQKIGCSIMHGDCPLCTLGDKAKPRWFYGVISRKTETYKILDVSFAVFSQIRKLARNPKWGDPTKYDINIEVDKNGGATGYYSVQPIPKEPLSAADQKLKDNADLDDLKRRCTPPTSEKVQSRMDRINGVTMDSTVSTSAGKKSATANNPATKLAVNLSAVSMTDDEGLEESFPAYGSGN